MSLLRPILYQALRHALRPAVTDDRATLNYGKLLIGSLHLARAIERATDRPNVGLLLPTSAGYPLALLACWLAGRVPVPINFLLSRADLHHVLGDAEVDTVLTVEPMLKHLEETLGSDPLPTNVNAMKLEEVKFKGLPPLRWPRNPGGDELAALLYTSGTSGKPKGVELTHANLYHNVTASITHAGLNERCVFLGILPQFHTFGLTILTLLPMYLGARMVYTARFNPRKIVELMREHRPDVFVAIPSMYHALGVVKSATPDDFASLRFVISGAEPLSPTIVQHFRERFNVHILEGYGLTETSPVANWSTPEHHRERSVGRPLPGVLNLILDENNQPVGSDVDGEIALSSPSVMRGYRHLPELTESVFLQVTPPGGDKPVKAFRTGDIGRIDGEGFLYITGRKKEMLIIGGENVFPREIEEALDAHESIQASAVVGRKDPSRGEEPIAFVELREGFTFDDKALIKHLRDRLPPFKVPREIRLIDALPRNATGKLLRRQLKVD